MSAAGGQPPPALGIVRGRRLTNRQIATQLGVSEGWVCRVLLGQAKPPDRLKQGLAKLTGCPAELLFSR